MDKKSLRTGQVVTWGTGSIRARVTSQDTFLKVNVDTDESEPFAAVELTKPYRTPCGTVVPAGFAMDMPVSELQELS